MVSFHKIRPETYFTPGVSGNPQGATVSLEKLDIYIYYNFYFAKKYIYKVTQYGSAYIHVLCLEYVSDQTYVQFCFTILFIFISACHIKNSQPSYLSLSFPFFFLSLIPIGSQLDISVNVPDILGTSQNALCPEMSCEQAALPAGPVPYEHQLDLLAVSLPSVIYVPCHICLLLWCPS